MDITTRKRILDYYATPGPLTDAGGHAARLRDLPVDVEQMVRIVHHLGIYDVVAGDFYGVALSEERAADIHVRAAREMFDRIVAVDDRPLSSRRGPDKRIGCRCHAFTKLIVTMLRAKEIPARARCGFSTYFSPGRTWTRSSTSSAVRVRGEQQSVRIATSSGHYEDHWVCEYWNENQARWVVVDAQLDEVWREKLAVDWDVLDVSRERFLVAADAWTRCREDHADPEHFGISFYEGLRGLWFIAGNLVRDAAALNKMEMLPWDVWGAAPGAQITFSEEDLAFYDRLAALTRSPDERFDELARLYGEDERLRVPRKVFNNLRQKAEPVA